MIYSCIYAFPFKDVHTVAVVKCHENYKAISESFKGVFDSINKLITEPTVSYGDTRYDVENFLSCDYKVANSCSIDTIV